MSKNLMGIRLAHNHLNGTIPSQFGQLSDLNFLDLSSNNFKGELPLELSNCKKISHFLVSNNQLNFWHCSSIVTNNERTRGVRSFPQQFQWNIAKSTQITVQDYRLSGLIPEEIGNLNSLNVLKLQRNNLSGTIPSTLGGCQKLFELRLSENSLTGSIPPELGTVTELQVILNLSTNHLTGEIPVSLANLLTLERLDLSFNELHGRIPESLGRRMSLHKLHLTSNHFQGEIPSTFSRFPSTSFTSNDKL